MNKLAIIAVVVLFPSVAFAAGGVFFDNFLMTNNGASVLADSFDSGRLAGWTAQSALLQPNGSNPAQYCLYLNRTTKGTSEVSQGVSLDNAGKVELTAWIYLAPEEQQDNWAGDRCEYAGFTVYASDVDDWLSASLYLSPQHKGYLAGVQWHDAVRKNVYVRSFTDKPVLDGGRWARATMCLDPQERTVSLLVDGKLACRISYQPERFKSVSRIALYSDLGGA
jgi:hypothetical protein